jgi:hypothetical protein
MFRPLPRHDLCSDHAPASAEKISVEKTALGETEGRKVFDARPDTPITQRTRLSFRRSPAVAWQG